MSSHFKLSQLWFFAALWLSPTAQAAAPRAADPVLGLWQTEDKEGVVAIYPCADGFCGRLYWIKPSDDPDDATAAIDDKNPDPLLRGRPLCGMEFMGGFRRLPDGGYASGWIYSPRHGATFSAGIKPLPDGTLEMRGFFLISLLGESQIWQPVERIAPCRAPS